MLVKVFQITGFSNGSDDEITSIFLLFCIKKHPTRQSGSSVDATWCLSYEKKGVGWHRCHWVSLTKHDPIECKSC